MCLQKQNLQVIEIDFQKVLGFHPFPHLIISLMIAITSFPVFREYHFSHHHQPLIVKFPLQEYLISIFILLSKSIFMAFYDHRLNKDLNRLSFKLTLLLVLDQNHHLSFPHPNTASHHIIMDSLLFSLLYLKII